MEKIKLHICLQGQHFAKAYDNIINLIDRVGKYKCESVEIVYNILYSTNNQEAIPSTAEMRELVKKLQSSTSLKSFEYDSKFFKSKVAPFRRCTPSASIVLHEPLYEFINAGNAEDDDFVLRCRSDYYLPDEFLQMVTSKEFYDKMLTEDRKYKILDSKIWMPYIGTRYICDFCDYFFVSRVRDLKKILIEDYKEACALWNDPILLKERSMFVEKIDFVKPFISLFKEKNLDSISRLYWDVIEDNFMWGGHQGAVRTLHFGWRACQHGKGKAGIKSSLNISPEEKIKYKKIVEKYGKFSPDSIVWIFPETYCDLLN